MPKGGLRCKSMAFGVVLKCQVLNPLYVSTNKSTVKTDKPLNKKVPHLSGMRSSSLLPEMYICMCGVPNTSDISKYSASDMGNTCKELPKVLWGR